MVTLGEGGRYIFQATSDTLVLTNAVELAQISREFSQLQ